MRQPETPSAIRKRIAVLLIRLPKFFQEKKLSFVMPTMIATMTSMTTIGLALT